MDRFSQELISNSAHMRRVWGEDDPLYTVVVNVCQNCQNVCEKLNYVPGYGYLGCDDCYGEAMAILAKEEKEIVELTPQETAEEWALCSKIGMSRVEATAWRKLFTAERDRGQA